MTKTTFKKKVNEDLCIEKIDKQVEKIIMREIGRDMRWKAIIKAIRKKMKKMDLY